MKKGSASKMAGSGRVKKPGSRGGKVVGYTKSGNPIYASSRKESGGKSDKASGTSGLKDRRLQNIHKTLKENESNLNHHQKSDLARLEALGKHGYGTKAYDQHMYNFHHAEWNKAAERKMGAKTATERDSAGEVSRYHYGMTQVHEANLAHHAKNKGAASSVTPYLEPPPSNRRKPSAKLTKERASRMARLDKDFGYN